MHTKTVVFYHVHQGRSRGSTMVGFNGKDMKIMRKRVITSLKFESYFENIS